MTGPEHYQHAEQLLDWASDEDFGSDAEKSRHAAALVHATLALAAATALPPAVAGAMREDDCGDWRAAVEAGR